MVTSSPSPYLSPSPFPPIDVPETKVQLGSSLDPTSIVEGMDLYFDCLVNAHPAAYRVEWRHNVSPRVSIRQETLPLRCPCVSPVHRDTSWPTTSSKV